MRLQKGENTILSSHLNKVTIYCDLDHTDMEGETINPLILFLDEKDQVIKEESGSEDPKSTPLSILTRDENHIEYEVDLNHLSSKVKKVIFAITIEELLQLKKNFSIGMEINNQHQQVISYELNDSSARMSYLLCEVYHYQKKWKIKAVGQAFKSGRREILELFSYPFSTKVVAVIDSSVYTVPYYENGELERLLKEIFIATSIINPTRQLDVWFFSTTYSKGPVVNQLNFHQYIAENFQTPGYFGGLGTENQEIPIIREMIKSYRYEDETFVLFLTNGNFHKPTEVTEILKGKMNHKFFWQFINCSEEEKRIGSLLRNIKNVNQITNSKDLPKSELHQRLIRPFRKWKEVKKS